jgi:hypothetical protein
MKISLERPQLPLVEPTIEWPRAIAIAGVRANDFALRIASQIEARVLRVELRHAEGFTIEGDVVRTHPSALVAAIEAARDGRVTIGVGGAFAVAVIPRVLVWIRGDVHPISLSPIERALVKRADLALEEPREGVADALAAKLGGAMTAACPTG